MRWRQVVLFWGVFAALGAEYWFVERQRPLPRPEERPPRERLLGMGRDDLREIRLRRGGRAVVSRRAGTAWVVVEPAGAAIPSDLIAAFGDALAAAEQIELVAGAEADPRAYGFDERAARVEVIAERGEPVVITIGGTNPTGTAVYARRGDAPAIVLIGLNVRYYEDLIFQSLPAARAPAVDTSRPVGG